MRIRFRYSMFCDRGIQKEEITRNQCFELASSEICTLKEKLTSGPEFTRTNKLISI